MKIECLLKRAGGTVVPMDDVEYHFAPNDKDVHVAEVTDKDHIEKFLAIPEAYAEVGAKKVQPKVKKAIALLGSDWQPTDNTLSNGTTVTTKELIDRAFAASSLEAEEWNASDKEFIEGQIISELDKLESAIEAGEGNENEQKTSEGGEGEKAETKTDETKLTKAEKKARLAARKAELGQK